MKVIELLDKIDFICHNKKVLFQDVKSIKINHQEVEEGDVFIALRGSKDGNDFIGKAYLNGAICAISDSGAGDIEVKNARSTYALMSKNFFGGACDRLKIIAVTGTNGKTTTCNMVADLIKSLGHKVGVIGTLGIKFDDEFIYNGFTTPDPFLLHQSFAEMEKRKIEYVVMEASAHAIFLNKLDYIKFEIVAFTSFSQDHLDYFGSMENYFNAKLKIFDKRVKLALVNEKIENIDKILQHKAVKFLTYGLSGDCDYSGQITEISLSGSKFYISNKEDLFSVKSNFVGKFNVENLLCAFAICCNLGFNALDIVEKINFLQPAEGRYNIIRGKNENVIIDFAHTPDGLEKVILSTKEISENVVVVFGCGGNRDSLKRPIMGKIASSLAKYVVITSDNPRYEKPRQIIKEIKKGAVKKNCKVIVNRKRAIKYALKHFSSHVIIIAGKGGEKYQEIKGKKLPYSDFDVVKKYLKI